MTIERCRAGILRGPRAAMAAAVALAALPAGAYDFAAGNRAVEPFKIAGNIYYVGASDLTAYLIATPAGLILLDGGLEATAPQIAANIEKLGFHLRDVKILLNSHAHFDHAGGLAELARRSGAALVASAGDAPTLASGGADSTGRFPPIKPARIIADGEKVALGGVEVVAHLTPGHTRGCTTWTTSTSEGGKTLDAVFVCSTTVLSTYRLGRDPTYPGIADDYRRTFKTLESLPCDLFLASHGSFFDLDGKRARLGTSAQNPFIDPEGYRRYVAEAEADFKEALAKEGPAAPRPAN